MTRTKVNGLLYMCLKLRLILTLVIGVLIYLSSFLVHNVVLLLIRCRLDCHLHIVHTTVGSTAIAVVVLLYMYMYV